MLNKPTVTDRGEWLLPCALWDHHFCEACEDHPELTQETLANIYVSHDEGETFQWRGGLMLDARAGVSHPNGIQGDDGVIYIIYDYDRYGERKILLAAFTAEDVLVGRPFSAHARFEQLVNQATAPIPKK